MSWPWQSGQSGQPSPESVARTMTPIVTSPRAVARVSAASFWKRFTGRHSTPAAGSDRQRYPDADESPTRPPAPVALALWLAACGSPGSPARARRGGRSAAAAPESGRRGDLGRRRPAPRPTLTPVLVSNAITCGKARILFLYLDAQNRRSRARRTGRRRSPSTTSVRDPPRPVATADGTFVWTIEDERGMYVLDVDLPEAGTWGAEFTTDGARLAGRDRAPDVRRPRRARRRSRSVQKAPASKTPTLADVGGDVDARSRPTPTPDPAFYQTSVADALAAHKPFMLVFATPKFCTSRAVRPDARPVQAGRRGPPRRDVHQRRAVQAPGRRRPAPAGPRRQQAARSSPPTSRTSGACSPSRGSSRSTATGSCAAPTS